MARADFLALQKLIWTAIIGVAPFLLTSAISVHKSPDPKISWDEEPIGAFNNEFAVAIDMEIITHPSQCHEGNPAIQEFSSNSSSKSRCPGNLHSCWVQTEQNSQFWILGDGICFCKCNRTHDNLTATDGMDSLLSAVLKMRNTQTRFFNSISYDPIEQNPGNGMCSCKCDRTRDNLTAIDGINSLLPTLLGMQISRNKLLDSFCYDPVEVTGKWVVTGTRFRRIGNRIHLEVRKTKLNDGRLYDYTSKWVIQNECQNQKKIFTRNSDGSYDFLKFILNSLMLPDGAVLTGVTLGESIVGRFLTDNGNINRKKPRIIVKIECPGTNNILTNFDDILPSTANVENTELSRPCKDHIVFNTTSFDRDFQQHIVPYVNLREVVTEPASSIRGIGFYYSGTSGYGGFLNLKLFTDLEQLSSLNPFFRQSNSNEIFPRILK